MEKTLTTTEQNLAALNITEDEANSRQGSRNKFYYMSIEIYVKYSAEIKFVFHCILYFSHVKKVVSAL